ncbi:MAG TPA: RimK family alpha-L-glutamate ligase [Nitrospinota bacterium]|nr:RimK family alpha-L-glutamate ligase [Nitrospinota bacterium]|tara:strand:- start:2821 stop:3729 length:909 start_codon:yes stop_codon:yes gene_type:complete
MKILILRSREGWQIDQLETSIKRRGGLVYKGDIRDLVLAVGDKNSDYSNSSSTPTSDMKPLVGVGNVNISDMDAVIVRVIPLGSLEQLMFRMNTLRRVVSMGVRVINHPEAIERTVDKAYTSHLLADQGMPTPKTVVCEGYDDAMAAFNTLGDVVVKPLHGSCGQGIVRICDPDTAYRVFRTMEMSRFVFYLQSFVDNGGEDTRVFVAGGKVIAAMKRRSNDWRNNFHRGSSVETIEPTVSQREMAIKAVTILGLDYAGIDFLCDGNGTEYIIEVNGIPGWRGLQKTCETTISDHIVGLVYQ